MSISDCHVRSWRHWLVDFFGKKGSVLDEFGANLAASTLPGGGHRRSHNRLVGLVMEMMKVAGVQAVGEAKNFLTGKITGASSIN